MCSELGRWLRVAGYDTRIINAPMEDEYIFQQAIKENRFLLTRDKHFKKIDPEAKIVIYLHQEKLDEWAQQLKSEGVNWLFAPFTRCLQCNVLFNPISKPAHVTVADNISEFWSCPTCDQIFWRGSHTQHMEEQLSIWQSEAFLTIGLGGDLMIGRLANEFLNHFPPSFAWGNLLSTLKNTDINLVNLETTLTHSTKTVPKMFNFKADPERVSILTEGKIDIVNIANNHILDYAEEGLLETIQVLDHAHIQHVGAGKNQTIAMSPCIIEKKGIKIGFLGCTDNEPSWQATDAKTGTFYLQVGDLSDLQEAITFLKDQVNLLILSIHWGPNMRQRPSSSFRAFAHKLIDLGVDILHGHSAHIFQGVEVYKNKLILYDTGDLIDDYAVDPILRNDRSFYFIVKVSKKGLIHLKMIPTIISECQVNIATDSASLDVMEALCKELNTYPERRNNALEINPFS